MSFLDTVKERVSNLETKHYYIIGGVAAAIIIVIILLVALSGFPGERFGDYSHGGVVARLAFNSSGSLLASSELNAQAKVFVWDVTSRTRMQAVDGNTRDSRMITFTQDDKVLVTVGLDETAWFWDANSGKVRREMKNIPLSSTSTLSPDGKWLAYCKGGKTFVWDLSLNRDKEEDVFDGDASGERAVTFSPDSTWLAAGDRSGVLRIYAVGKKNLEVPQKGHKSAIVYVAFSPEGALIGTASEDGTAKLWDTKGKEKVSFKEGHEGTVVCLAIGPEARVVLTGGMDKTARLWDGKSGREIFKFENFRGEPDSMVAISADGSLAAIKTAGSGIEVFETKSSTSVIKIEVEASVFTFAPTGNTLFFGRPNGKIYTWTRGMK